MFVAITGNPVAIASSTVLGIPRRVTGSKNNPLADNGSVIGPCRTTRATLANPQGPGQHSGAADPLASGHRRQVLLGTESAPAREVSLWLAA